MAKQKIYIEGRAGNERIEKAIPKLQKKFGMKKDQATATAIRMESAGELKDSGQPTKKGTTRSTAAIIAAVAASKRRQRQKQQVRQQESVKVENVEQLRKKTKRYTRTLKRPKKRKR